MNKVLKHIIISVMWLALAVAFAAAYAFGTRVRKDIVCNNVEIVILDSLRNDFVSRTDVAGYLKQEYGECIGMKADSIDRKRIEEIIDGESAVFKSQAYVTNDGTLHIHVTQRKPIVRFQKSDGGFYADADGYIFPLQNNFASHVQVIDGCIPLAADSGYKGAIEDSEEKEWFDKIMKVVNFIEEDRDWNEKIVQISVDRNGNLTMIPRKGNEKFLFGQPEDIEEKFGKMEKYYTHIIPAKGDGYYSTVNLNYKGQIVCRKDKK